ncbi:MAG: FeoC-like transcriptional regulator [Anaerolineae bacterium]
MLQSALRLIAAGEALSSGQLAQRLDVSPEIAKGALEQLVRLGYLKPSGADTCKAACSGCPQGQACFVAAQLWALTEKGRRAAQAA